MLSLGNTIERTFSSTMSTIEITPPRPEDKPGWRRLYDGYAAFYKVPMDDAIADRVWGWIFDPAHEVKALIARDPEGRPIGLAHYRPFARPLRGAVGCFLDDLFVDPAHRGGGAADALLAALRELSRARGWNVVRWITADDNYRGRGVYDRHATRTMWITYDMPVPAQG